MYAAAVFDHRSGNGLARWKKQGNFSSFHQNAKTGRHGRFCNGSDLSSHASATEIGWTLSVWPPFCLEQIQAHLFQWRTREKVSGEDKEVDVWFRLTSARFVHGVFIQRCSLGLVVSILAAGRISIGNWLFWVVLSLLLSSHTRVL